MRTLWNVVSFLAVVHLLAVLMLTAWLWHSRRLDGDRIQAMREMLAQPVTEDAAAEATAPEAAPAIAGPSAAMSSGAQVELASMLREQMAQSVRWLEDEKRMLTEQLERATAQIELQEQAFNTRQSAWETSIEADRQRRVDEQFAKAVRQVESVPPKQARQMLTNLVEDGLAEQAVAYLDAMNPRAAAKILREFKSDLDTRLATELLERLRTFGLEAEAIEDAVNDANAVDTSP